MEDTNFLEDLQQAPPGAPTSASVDAEKAAQSSKAAAMLAASNPFSTPSSAPTVVAAKSGDKQLINPKAATDTRTSDQQDPPPGSFAFHLTNALIGNITDPKAAAAMAAPGGGTRSLFSSGVEALAKYSAQKVAAAAQTAPGAQQTQSTPVANGIQDSSQSPNLDTDEANKYTSQGAQDALAGIGVRTNENPDAPAAKKPGLASRIFDKVGKVGEVLGDSANAAGPGGFFGGLSRTEAAATQRENLERQTTATANAQMLHEQALIHKTGNDAVDASIASGKDAIAQFTAPPPEGGVQVKASATGKTSDELNQMIQTGQLDPTKETAFPDGKKLIGQWPDGQPKYQTTYSVIPLKGEVSLTPETAKRLNQVLGGDGSGNKYSESDDPNKQQKLPAADLNAQIQKANTTEAVAAAFAVGYNTLLEKKEAHETSELAKTIEGNPAVASALNAASAPASGPHSPDPYAAVKAYPALLASKDPRLPANWQQAFKEAATGETGKDADTAWTEMNNNFAKAQQKNVDTANEMLTKVESAPQEIEGHTPAFTAALRSIASDPNASTDQKERAKKGLAVVQSVRQLELELEGAKAATAADAKQKAAQGPESDKIGADYLSTLPQSRRSLLTGIANGQIPASPSALQRTDKGQALVADLFQAFPDFDASKGETWYKTRNEYTGTGATAKTTVNFNHALELLQDVYRTSTTDGLYKPGTKDYSDRQVAITAVKGEIGKAIKSGVVTDAEAKDLGDALSGWLPSTAQERAAHMADIMHKKLDEFQTTFDKAAPSAFVQVPKLISPQAQKAVDFINSGGKTPAAIVRPANAGPDWKFLDNGAGVQKWFSPQDAAVAIGRGAKEVKQ